MLPRRVKIKLRHYFSYFSCFVKLSLRGKSRHQTRSRLTLAPLSGPRHPSAPHALIWRRGVLTWRVCNNLNLNVYIKMNEFYPPVFTQFMYISHCKLQIFKCRIKLFCFSLLFSCRVPSRLASVEFSRAQCCSPCWPRLGLYSLFHSPDSLCTCLTSGRGPLKAPSHCPQPKATLDTPRPSSLLTTSALPRIPGDEKLSCCAHIWNLSDDKIINVEANIVSDILSQPWELSQSQFLILKAQE